jgi:hypothetical protein
MLNASDFYISLPSPIATLDHVAAELRENYEPRGGAYVLTQAARDEIARCNAETDELVARDNATLAEMENEGRRLDALLADRVISGALDDALVAAGVNPKRARGAAALLRKEWQFAVADDHQVRVTQGGTTGPLGHAVAEWLQSDAGEIFAERKPEAKRGAFATLFARVA